MHHRFCLRVVILCSLVGYSPALAAQADAGTGPDAAVDQDQDSTSSELDAAIEDSDAGRDRPVQVQPDVNAPAAPSLTPPADEEPHSVHAQAAGPVSEGEAADIVELGGDEPLRVQDDSSEMLVVGTRLTRTAGSAHIVQEEQLARFEYDDPHAVLQQVPGVYVRQEDGIGLRPNIAIRGANPDRSKKVTLLEDGVLLGPAPYSAPAAYYFPLLTRMVQLRVLAGPAAIAHGPQTVGGSIDLVTRAIPRDKRAYLDLAGGAYGYAKLHAYAGASTDQFGVLFEGVHLHNAGFKVLPNGADTGSTRSEIMVKGSYVPDPDGPHELRLKLTYSEESSNETYLGLSDADFRADPLQRYAASALDRMDNHRTSVVLTHIVDLPEPQLKLTTHVYRHNFIRSWRKLNRLRGASVAGVLAEPDDPINAELLAVLRGQADSAAAASTLYIGPNARDFVSQGVQSTLLGALQSGAVEHRVEVGVRAHYDRIERRHSEDAFIMRAGELVPVTDEATTVTTANRAYTAALALHMVDAMSWDELTVTPGVRLELMRSELQDWLAAEDSHANTSAWMPGLGVSYALVPTLTLLSGVYRGFSPPPPGAQGVTPELSVNYEAGARLQLPHGRAEWIGFFNDYQNLTDICTLSSGCLNANLDNQFDAGRAHIYGFEAFFTYDLPLGSVLVPITTGYTFTRARFRNEFESLDPIYGSVRKGDEVPYVPRHQVNATVGVQASVLGAYVGFNYVSAMREQAGSGPLERTIATDELINIDASAQLQLLPGLQLYVNLRNILDRASIVARRPYGARPNAPRWLQMGVKGEL